MLRSVALNPPVGGSSTGRCTWLCRSPLVFGRGGMTVRCRSARAWLIAAVVRVGRNGSPASAGGTVPRWVGAMGVIPGGGGGGDETGRLVGPSIRLGMGSARPGGADTGGPATAAGAIGAGATGGGVTGAGATGGGPRGRGDASGALTGAGSGRLRRPVTGVGSAAAGVGRTVRMPARPVSSPTDSPRRAAA